MGGGWLSYYLVWLLIPMAIGLVSAHPSIIAVAVVALVARRWIPDPYLFFKHLGRVHALRAQIEANPANVTARRDLARIYLEKRRPRRAIPLLEEALPKDPDAEMYFLLGIAYLRAGAWEKALPPLVESVAKDHRFRYGEPYLGAGDALAKLGRLDEAEDAYERFRQTNSSSLEGLVKLAGVRERKQDREGTRKALAEAVTTFRQLPAFQRRRQWLWYLRARLFSIVS